MAARTSQYGLGSEDLSQIYGLIAANPVCGVVAPTGSGKSTFLVEDLYRRGNSVYVVEPTIPAVKSLRNRMQSKLGEANVGSAAEGSVQYFNPKIEALRAGKSIPEAVTGITPVVYCTSGHMRRVMLAAVKYALGALNSGAKDVKLNFCNILILDEAHNGSLDLEIIMALWNFAYSRSIEVPRLVLTSATLTIQATIFPGAPTYVVKTPGFEVKIEYYSKDFELGAPDLYPEIGKAIIQRHSRNLEHKNPTATKGSTWLVFCAGVNEVTQVVQSLQAARDPTLVPIPVFSSMGPEETMKIFEPTPKGIRRVVVATNIAEVAITIDNVTGIFDSLTEKYNETSISGGLRLVLHYTSKASAQQRAGRTGRTAPGFVVRMCTQEFFNQLPEQRPAEITRVPLDSVTIEIMEIGLNPLFLFKTGLTPDRFRRSISNLETLGMITQTTGPDDEPVYAVTEIGRFAPHFPLSIRGVATLWSWLQLNKPLFPGIVAVSLIDCYGGSYFWYPGRGPQNPDSQALIEKHYATFFERFQGKTDLTVLVNMWNFIGSHFQRIDPKSKQITDFCTTNSLNAKKIRELFSVIRQTTNALAKLGHTIQLGPFTAKGVLDLLVPILTQVYSDRVYVQQGTSRNYIDVKTSEEYRIDLKNRLSDAPFPNRILGLLTIELSGGARGGPSRLISLYQPITGPSRRPERKTRHPPRSFDLSTRRPAQAKSNPPQIIIPRTQGTQFTPLSSIQSSVPAPASQAPKSGSLKYVPKQAPPNVSVGPRLILPSSTQQPKAPALPSEIKTRPRFRTVTPGQSNPESKAPALPSETKTRFRPRLRTVTPGQANQELNPESKAPALPSEIKTRPRLRTVTPRQISESLVPTPATSLGLPPITTVLPPAPTPSLPLPSLLTTAPTPSLPLLLPPITTVLPPAPTPSLPLLLPPVTTVLPPAPTPSLPLPSVVAPITTVLPPAPPPSLPSLPPAPAPTPSLPSLLPPITTVLPPAPTPSLPSLLAPAPTPSLPSLLPPAPAPTPSLSLPIPAVGPSFRSLTAMPTVLPPLIISTPNRETTGASTGVSLAEAIGQTSGTLLSTMISSLSALPTLSSSAAT